MVTAEKIRKNYKAAIAFLTPMTLLLVTVSSNPDIANALPGVTEWLVVVGIPAVSGFLTWLKRNEPTVDEALEIYKRAQTRAANGK